MKIRVMLKLVLTFGLLMTLLPSCPGPWTVNAASEPARASTAQRPLGELLNPDGSLNLDTGFSGSLDPTGWQMSYAEDGAPVFTPASTANTAPPPTGLWRALGNGLNGDVRAIAVAGANVYVGGDFTDAGGLANADNIARWNSLTNTWSALGSGLSATVETIAIAGVNVYVGGWFSNAGGNANADYIAHWDGNAWNALSADASKVLNSGVMAIVVSGPDLYVGGLFTDAGGKVYADYIANWHNGDWFPLRYGGLGSGLNGPVFSLATAGPNLYVGGMFTDAGGDPDADYIARWHIADWTWNALGAGVNNAVLAVAAAGAHVYIGGMFTDAGGDSAADHIARWDGNAWHALGSGVNDNVRDIAVVGSSVYVGGDFSDAGGIAAADHIARWDGSAWKALHSGVNDDVMAITAEGADVYVGGKFTNADTLPAADHIVRWDTRPDEPAWDAVGEALNNTVQAIVIVGSDVYVGGWFTNVGGNADADGIARWDGASWQALGNGISGVVYTISIVGEHVYVGGSFTNAGGNASADYIARWDGTSWQALGSGLNSVVFDIVAAGTDVYVGGMFTDAGGNSAADHIARWDGAAWYALGAGLNDRVFAIAVVGPDVYVGGDFTDAGGNAHADYVACWRNATWFSLRPGFGTGLNGSVYALAVAGPDLYVGGSFTTADGVPNAYIARWNIPTFTWNTVGNGLNNYVSAIAVAGQELYIGGGFTDAGGSPSADHIARLYDTVWQALGNGVFDTVLKITPVGPDVYVGGKFYNVDGIANADYIARWGAVYKHIYLPLTLSAYNPDLSTLTDPAGDWLPGAVQLASTDIRAASVERRPAEGVILLTMELAGDLPQTLPPEERNRWMWALDTDMNAGSGEPWYSIGAEYEVNLHIQWDGFYVDVRDASNNWTPVPDAATISGNKVTIRLPISYIGDATRCNWMVIVEPFDRAGTRFDIAPNSGFAQLQ